MTLLQVENLSHEFRSGTRFRPHRVQAVRSVTFNIDVGETLGVVGESGCGKSTLARTVVQLLRPTEGTITLDGREVQAWDRSKFCQAVQMVFQDPYASLNPRMTVGELLAEPFLIHQRKRRSATSDQVVQLLDAVGLAPEYRQRYPHEFSGGQRQRIGIARAIALNPRLLVLDEAVSALDVSVQAGVLNLLADLQADRDLTYLFIAHDLSVVRHVAHRVAVMYLGSIVEIGTTESLFNTPRHPYTKALLSAVPVPNPDLERQRERIVLHGDVPSPANPPSGCSFRTRCWKATDRCSAEVPVLSMTSSGQQVACHFPE